MADLEPDDTDEEEATRSEAAVGFVLLCLLAALVFVIAGVWLKTGVSTAGKCFASAAVLLVVAGIAGSAA